MPMAQAYTPGLKVTRRVVHRSRRALPIAGDVLVKQNQLVAARDVVARAFLPGSVTPVNVANLLSIPPSEISGCLLKREGESVVAGEVFGRSKGIFGWFRTECTAPASGTIEAISNVTGQIMIRGEPAPIELRAWLTGRVIEVLPKEGAVVECEATMIQGIFGIGGEAIGEIRMACSRPDETLSHDKIVSAARGAVIVGGARVTAEAIAAAVETGVAAIITGGIDDYDLRNFLGYDLGVAVTGSENVGLTLIITEGFGDVAMAERTFRLLESRAGEQASVNGATQIRAGVVRPEIVIPWKSGTESGTESGQESGPAEQEKGGERRPVDEAIAAQSEPRGRLAGVLAPGAAVRIIRDPYFGMIGAVATLPPEPVVLGSGSKARVLEVSLPSGQRVMVPRANVELIEE
jgi:hypothetical protein